MNKSRHPTERHPVFSTDTHTLISCGTKEREVLEYVSKLEGALNKSLMARTLKRARTTIISNINRLRDKGLIETDGAYTIKLTTKGENYLGASLGENRGVENLRRGCRKGTLSVHYLRFILPLKNSWEKFDPLKIPNLKLNNHRTLNNKNMPQHLLYYENATIIINKYQVAIRIHDVVDIDTENAIFNALNKALDLLPDLKYLGLNTESITLEDPHYTRVESLLADALSKINGRYFLELKDGTKFWIDNSGKKINPEDETNRELARIRVDKVMKDIIENDIDLKDLDKLKSSLADLSKFTISNFLENGKDIKKLIGSLTILTDLNKPKKQLVFKNDNNLIDYVG